jgi:tetratricopeptide (TPR) repeat protein
LEFIYEKSLYPELEYVFRHALTQEVAYDSLLLKRRKQIHEKIGKSIEELYPDRLEEFCEALAHHYSTAENWEKAFQYLKLSAEKAHRRYSTKEAFRYYSEAMNTLGQLPDTEENKRAGVDITMSMPSVMVALNFPEGCLRILEQGVRSAEELGDRPVSARLYAAIGMAYLYTGNTVEGQKFTLKAFEEAEKLGDESAVSRTAVNLCNVYLNCGEAVRVADVAARAIALLERTQRVPSATMPEFDQYVMLLYLLGWAEAVLGDFDEGERLCEKGIRSAAEIRSQYSLAGAHVLLGVVSIYRGKPERLLGHAREAMRLSEEVQIPLFLGISWFMEGYGHYYQGDLAVARESVEKSISLMLHDGVVVALSPAYLLSGLVSQAMGNLPEARRSFEQALKVAQENNQKHFEGHARIYLGRLIIEEDTSQIALAAETILKGLKMVQDLQMKPLQAMGHLYLGETYAVAGQKEKALSSLKKAHQMCQEMGMDYFLARTEKALKALRG